MDIQIKKHETYTEFIISGEMYVDDAAQLRNVMLENEKNTINYVVNLSNLSYIDSSGLGLLVSFHKKAVTTNGSFKIRGLHESIQKLFELTRLNLVFDIQ